MWMHLLLVLACGEHHDAEAPHDASHDAAHEAPVAHEGAAHGAAGAHAELLLSLDGDKKWVMDGHTRKTMALTQASVDGATVDSPEAAAALGAELKGQLDTLIEGCEMTGASHDELHVFLMAWMPAVDALGKAPDAAAAKAAHEATRGLLVEYGRFFE